MVDDFMVCVDRIIASACFESVHGGVFESAEGAESISANAGVSLKNNGEGCSKKEDMVECRICQEEGEERDMEAPCGCNGTLKFAHRKCIQRWCNKKGDITCEICCQVFSPNYSLPPHRANPDVMAIDIRQAWGPHIDLGDPRLLALAAAEHQLIQSEYEEYAVASSGTLSCFRSVALILMVVLLLRQAMMITRDSGMVQESSAFFNEKELTGYMNFSFRFHFFNLLDFFYLAMSWPAHGTLCRVDIGGRYAFYIMFLMED